MRAPKLSQRKRIRANSVDGKLALFAEELTTSGGKVPAHGAWPNRPYNTAIARLIGVHPSQLCTASRRALLVGLGETNGYAVQVSSASHDQLIVAELRFIAYDTVCPDQLSLTPEGFKEARASALIEAARHESGAGGNALEAVKAAIAAADADDRRRGPVYRILCIWRDHVEQFAPDGRPVDARERLRLELKRRNMKSAELARIVGADEKRLGLIISVGDRMFSRRDESLKRKIEQALGLELKCLSLPGQLKKRGAVALTVEDYPPEKRYLGPAERSRLSLYLPENFAGMSDAEKVAAVDEALALIARKKSPEDAARARLRRDAYALRGQLPKRLDGEIAALRQFYCGPFVPNGKINKRRRWSEATMLLRENTLRLIGGWLCASSRGPHAVDPAKLSVVMLLHPMVIKAHLAYRHRRAEVEFRRSHLTEEDVNVWMLARTLLDPENGGVRQAEKFASRLLPIAAGDGELIEDEDEVDDQESADQIVLPDDDDPLPGEIGDAARWLVSPHDVGRAQSDWFGYCNNCHAQLATEIRNHFTKTRQSRNAHTAIEAILRHEAPRSALLMMVDGLRDEAQQLHRASIAYAEVQRDAVAVLINSQVAFRSRTFCALDMAHLRREANGYIIEVPRTLFKNSTGPYFVVGHDGNGHPVYRDFRMRLLDRDGLYDALDFYLAVGRKRLLRGRPASDALIVGGRGPDGRITAGALDQMIRRVFSRHVIHNPMRGTGFEGQHRAAGWHCFRHIIATDVLKATGSYPKAADAIHDSEAMVRSSYARYHAADRIAEQEATLDAGLLRARRLLSGDTRPSA